MKRLTGLILAAVAAASAGAATLNTNREEVLAYFAENVYGVRPDLSQFEKKQAVVACTNDPIFRAMRRDSFDYRPGRNKLYFDRHGWFSEIFPGLDPTEACGISSTGSRSRTRRSRLRAVPPIRVPPWSGTT